MKKNQLSVRLYGLPVGILTQLPTGKMSFVYAVSAKKQHFSEYAHSRRT